MRAIINHAKPPTALIFAVSDTSGRRRIRTSEVVRQLIYSQPPLATWVSAHVYSIRKSHRGTLVGTVIGLWSKLRWSTGITNR